jgi:hypothetical protein
MQSRTSLTIYHHQYLATRRLYKAYSKIQTWLPPRLLLLLNLTMVTNKQTNKQTLSATLMTTNTSTLPNFHISRNKHTALKHVWTIQCVSLVCVMGIAALTGCPGRSRLCMRQSCHALCGDKRKILYLRFSSYLEVNVLFLYCTTNRIILFRKIISVYWAYKMKNKSSVWVKCRTLKILIQVVVYSIHCDLRRWCIQNVCERSINYAYKCTTTLHNH